MSAADVLEQIAERTARPAGLTRIFSRHPFVGWVRGDRVSLHSRLVLVRNSFERSYVGQVSDQGARTLLRGRFQMQPFVVAFMAIWLSLALLISGVVLIGIVTGAPCTGSACGTGLPFLIFAAFPVFAATLMTVGIALSLPQEKKVTRFLMDELQFRPVETSDGESDL